MYPAFPEFFITVDFLGTWTDSRKAVFERAANRFVQSVHSFRPSILVKTQMSMVRRPALRLPGKVVSDAVSRQASAVALALPDPVSNFNMDPLFVFFD